MQRLTPLVLPLIFPPLPHVYKPVFPHVQLYVALSRSGIPADTKILIRDETDRQGNPQNRQGLHRENIVVHYFFICIYFAIYRILLTTRCYFLIHTITTQALTPTNWRPWLFLICTIRT